MDIGKHMKALEDIDNKIIDLKLEIMQDCIERIAAKDKAIDLRSLSSIAYRLDNHILAASPLSLVYDPDKNNYVITATDVQDIPIDSLCLESLNDVARLMLKHLVKP